MPEKPTYEELEKRIRDLENRIAISSKKDPLAENHDARVSTSPHTEPEIAGLDLAAIIDVKAIQSLMDHFYKLTNIGVAILDLNGEILIATGWQDICTKFHRVHPESRKNCLESDLELSNGIKPGEFRLYRCKNHMWDMSTPIMVGGRKAGSLYLGQFLFEDESADVETFRCQARKYGFDENAYISAVQRVPRWSRLTVDTVMNFYTQLADLFSQLGFRNFMLAESIAEKNHLLDSLSESEEKYRELVENLNDVIYSVDNDGTITYVSPLAESIFGYPDHEIVGRRFSELIYLEDREMVSTAFMRVLQGNLAPMEYRIQTKNDEIRWVRTSSRPIDKNGRVTGLQGVLTDITNHKTADAALQKSEEKLRAMLNASPLAILLIDRNGRVLESNEEHAGRLQMTRAQITGKCIWDLLPESVRVHRKMQVETVFETGEPFSGEDKRGNVWNAYHIHPAIKNNRNEIEAVIVEALDISERKRSEEALKESKMFLDNMSDIAYIADAQGNVTWVNSAFARITGIPPEEIIGKPFLPLFIKDDHASLIDVYKKTLLGGSLENTLTFTSGVTCHFTSLPKRNDKGEIIGTFGVARDITARLIAQKALQVSEDRLKKAQEAAGIGNWEYDMSTGRVWGSEEAFRIYEIERTSEYLPLDEVESHIIDAERVNQALVDLITKGEDYDIEFQITQKNSQRLLTIHSIADLIKDDEGNPVKVLGVIQDVTDKKVKEQEHIKLLAQLQQAQKMEAIGTLAGGIAHDFNNLLMAIQGRASIMLMNKDSSHPDIRHLKGIEDDIESAADLTRQLLGFARGGKYEVRPTDLNEVIKKQNRMFGRTKKEISIRGKYEKDLWSVEVDRGQFEQVLLNLYVNAWQAMPGGGDLYLKTENVTINRTDVKPFSIEPGRYVKISVTDTGVGMDKKTREKIFEPFFTTKEMGRGTGLGLASAYGIIKNHGGFINVYSEKGHGATFNIYLPASEKEVIEEKKPAGETVSGTETVLFVDDEDMIIELAEELFEGLGYKVLTAGSGREAIETYEKNKERIDMVLLDMVMPDMGGDETYDKLKKINPDIKVLLASGYSMNGQATEIMDRGCSGFIQKPFKMRELSQKLREILDGK